MSCTIQSGEQKEEQDILPIFKELSDKGFLKKQWKRQLWGQGGGGGGGSTRDYLGQGDSSEKALFEFCEPE